MLDVRVPVWITDIQFFPQEINPSGNMVAVGTFYHHVLSLLWNTNQLDSSL